MLESGSSKNSRSSTGKNSRSSTGSQSQAQAHGTRALPGDLSSNSNNL